MGLWGGMRSLLFHCQDFGSTITGLATRPKTIVPAEVSSKTQSVKDCVLVFVTLEKGDTKEKAHSLAKEIIKFCEETKHMNVFLCPFAHLSNNLASSKEATEILREIVSKMGESDVVLTEGHFGSDKELLIHLYGHPGNARYREF